MKLGRLLVASLALSGLAALSLAQKYEELDVYVEKEMTRQHIPGLSLAIVGKDGLLHAKAYGKSDLERGDDVHLGSVFKIGSISKPILATTAMRLQEMGKLSIERPVRELLPELPESWAGIRVKHLLSHTAGLPRELPGWEMTKEYTDAELLKMITTAAPTTVPGSRYAYSNCGYFTLAQIIAKVGGKPWREVVNELIFVPAAMKRAATTDFIQPDTHRVLGYEWRNGKFEAEGVLKSVRPSGAFQATCQDLVEFDIATRGGKIVTKDSFAQMLKPFKFNDGKPAAYGLGWSLEHYRGRSFTGHSGALQGFRSSFIRSEQDGYTVIVLTNSASADAPGIAKGVFRWLAPSTSLKQWKPRADDRKPIGDAIWDGLKNVGEGKPFGELALPALGTALGNLGQPQKNAIKGYVEKSSGLEFLRFELCRTPTYRNEVLVQQIRYYRFASKELTLFVIASFSDEGKLIGLEVVDD